MAGGLWFVGTAKPGLDGYQVANHSKSLGETHPSATILHVFWRNCTCNRQETQLLPGGVK